MSIFCGYIGKTDDTILKKISESIRCHFGKEPTCFSDGYITLVFESFENERKRMGHSEDFTKWVMIDTECEDNRFMPENILKAYEEKGISFVKGLTGTYSVMLWDGVYKKLYLIKDNFGAKGLFYAKTKDGIVFGSRISEIICHSDVVKTINKRAIYQYMSYQSIYPPDTAFEGVFQVPSGSYLEYTDGLDKVITYREIPFGQESKDTYKEATEKVAYLLEKSLRNCMQGEMGIFLSGGVDSSVLTAMAKEERNEGMLKYAFCLEPYINRNSVYQKKKDAVLAKKLADTYGMQYYHWHMGAEDLIQNVDAILQSFGQPFSGTMSGYFLGNYCKKICNKILTGDGADELFGGYGYHAVLLPLEKYGECIQKGYSLYDKKEELAPFDTQMTYLDNLYQYVKTDDVLTYYRLLQITDEEKELFLNREMFGEFIEEKYTLKELVYQSGKLKSKGALNRCLERDFMCTLPGHTMFYADALAKSTGICCNTPFLNDELVKYVVTLPQEYKRKEGQMKAILKEVGSHYITKEYLYRKKEPFSLPVAEWMKKELKEYVTDILSPASVRKNGILNEVCVEYALREFYKNPEEKAYYGPMLWTMTMLERWISLYQ